MKARKATGWIMILLLLAATLFWIERGRPLPGSSSQPSEPALVR